MNRVVLVSVFLLLLFLIGCAADGKLVDRAGSVADSLIGEFNPWVLMGWIGAICLIAAAFLAMNMKLIQAAMSLAVGIAFLFLAEFLHRYGTIVILIGMGAAVWFGATYWGMIREQIRAWFASRKLEIEGRRAEAMALKRQAFPVLDWRMRRGSRRRRRAARKSGAIKPKPKEVTT